MSNSLWIVIGLLGAGVVLTSAVALIIYTLRRRRQSESKTHHTKIRWFADWAKKTTGAIKPHLSSTLGVWVLILLFLAGVTVHTAPDTAMKLWWLLPLGLVVVFLILRASTIKSSLARFAGVAAVVFGAGVLILPKLPGSTSGQPPKLTRSQEVELAGMHTACPGTKEKQKFLRTYTTIDPQGLCKAVLWAPGRCLYVQNELNHEFGPFCDKPGGNKEVPGIIKAVRSADEEFEGYIELHPNYKRLSFIY